MEISTLSGVFPADDMILSRFCEEYMKCISEADIVSLWGVGAEANGRAQCV